MKKENKRYEIDGNIYEIVTKKGEQFIYQILSNGTKKEATLNFGELVALTKAISNDMPKPKEEVEVLKPVKLPKRFVSIALASSSILASLSLGCTLIKDSKIGNIDYVISSFDDISNAISSNDNIPDEIKPFVLNYVETMHDTTFENTLTFDNLRDIKFVCNDEYFNGVLDNAMAAYIVDDNTIVYKSDVSTYSFINHECIHSDSVKFSKSCENGGKAINEAFAAQEEWEKFGTKSYQERDYAKMIALIVGKKKVTDIFHNGTLIDLRNEMVAYSDGDSFDKMIISADSIKDKELSGDNTTAINKTSVYNYFIDTFFNKLSCDVFSKKAISMDDYLGIMTNIWQFEKVLDNNEYFSNRLGFFNKNLEAKFKCIADYCKDDKFQKTRGMYKTLSKDEISYMSDSLTYHYNANIYMNQDNSEFVEVSCVVGANMDFINSNPNCLPNSTITTVSLYNANGAMIDRSFENVNYFVDEALSYSDSFEKPKLSSKFQYTIPVKTKTEKALIK